VWLFSEAYAQQSRITSGLPPEALFGVIFCIYSGFGSAYPIKVNSLKIEMISSTYTEPVLRMFTTGTRIFYY